MSRNADVEPGLKPLTMSVVSACHRPVRHATAVGHAFMEVMMTRLSTIATIPALAVSLALAGPVLAQPTAGQQAGGPAQAAAPARRTVTGRELMTPQERTIVARGVSDDVLVHAGHSARRIAAAGPAHG